MNKLRFETNLNKIEDNLIYGSCIPFFGAVPSLARSGLGVIQLTSAAAIAVFTAIPTALGNEKAKDLFFYSWTHVKHGTGNICGGLIQTIPLATLLGIYIWHRLYNIDYGLQFEDKQPFKFMRYPTLTMDGHLTFNREVFGPESWIIDDEIDNMIEGMSAKKAIKLGLLNNKCETIPDYYQKLRQDYLSNNIPIKGSYKSERDAKVEKCKRESKSRPRLKVCARAGFGGRKKR